MISKTVRQQVRTIYAFCCGYCGVTESEVGSELTVDHFRPRSQGGTNELENLVYACYACNGYKGAIWNPEMPPVLHPLLCDSTQHFREQPDGTFLPLTVAGQRHIDALHLNRTALVLRRNGLKRLQSIREQQESMEERLQSLERLVRASERSISRSGKRRN